MEELRGHTSAVHLAVFSPNSRLMGSGSAGCTIRVREAETGGCIQELGDYIVVTDPVTSVASSIDKTLIASGAGKTPSAWCVSTGENIQIFQGYSDFVDSVGFSPNYDFLISGSLDTTVRTWRGKTEECVRELPAQGGRCVLGSLLDRCEVYCIKLG